MTNNAFWKSCAILLHYKRMLLAALVGVIISAGCFGAGIGSVYFVLNLLLKDKRPLDDLIRSKLADPHMPQLVQDLGNYLAMHVPPDPFYAFVLIMAAIAALSVIGSCGRYLHEYMTLTAVEQATMEYRSRLFRRLIHAPLVQVLETGTADHIGRLVGDTRVMAQGYQALTDKAVASLLQGMAAASVAIWFNWRLTIGAIICGLLTIPLMRSFGKRIRRASRGTMNQRGRMIGMLHESLGGIRVVKVHNAEGHERRRFQKINRSWFREEMHMRQAKALSSPLVETLALLGVIMGACVAAWSIFRHNVPPDQLLQVLLSLAAAGASFKPLTGLSNQLHASYAAADRVMAALDLEVEPVGLHAQTPALALPRHQRDILFEGVSFSYPGQNRLAIRNVTLHVQHGQTVAIVGGNGSGKSTLLSLLPRLIAPSSGRVLIDGVDISQTALRSLRDQMAAVTQQTVLFEGTISQNIAYGWRERPMDQIKAAATAAYADEFVRELPHGYETVLGEGGEGLSGGQKQRLCLARAILRDPAILVLDEATSQIDSDSESKISRALRVICRGRTTFIIAHRLSTVIDADQIIVMSDGQIVGQGTHAQLLQSCSIYQTLVATQLQPLDK